MYDPGDEQPEAPAKPEDPPIYSSGTKFTNPLFDDDQPTGEMPVSPPAAKEGAD